MIPERKAQLREVAGEFGDFETLGLLDDLEAAENTLAEVSAFLFHLRAAAAEWLAEHPDDRNAPAVRRALLGTQ